MPIVIGMLQVRREIKGRAKHTHSKLMETQPLFKRNRLVNAFWIVFASAVATGRKLSYLSSPQRSKVTKQCPVNVKPLAGGQVGCKLRFSKGNQMKELELWDVASPLGLAGHL